MSTPGTPRAKDKGQGGVGTGVSGGRFAEKVASAPGLKALLHAARPGGPDAMDDDRRIGQMGILRGDVVAGRPITLTGNYGWDRAPEPEVLEPGFQADDQARQVGVLQDAISDLGAAHALPRKKPWNVTRAAAQKDAERKEQIADATTKVILAATSVNNHVEMHGIAADTPRSVPSR